MLPNVNFNPSFANLSALRGMGGMPHPIRPGPTPMPGPVGPQQFAAPPNPYATPAPQMPGPQQMAPAPMGPTGGLNPMNNLPMQTMQPQAMQPQAMQPPGNIANLQALMQRFGRPGGFRG